MQIFKVTRGNSKFSAFPTPFIVSLLRIICGEINDSTESVSYILKGGIDSPVFFRRVTLLEEQQRYLLSSSSG